MNEAIHTLLAECWPFATARNMLLCSTEPPFIVTDNCCEITLQCIKVRIDLNYVPSRQALVSRISLFFHILLSHSLVSKETVGLLSLIHGFRSAVAGLVQHAKPNQTNHIIAWCDVKFGVVRKSLMQHYKSYLSGPEHCLSWRLTESC